MNDLNFHPIQNAIALQAYSEPANERVWNLTTLSSKNQIQSRLENIDEMIKFHETETKPPISDFTVSPSIFERMHIGAVLSGGEIRMVFRLLLISRQIANFGKKHKEVAPNFHLKSNLIKALPDWEKEVERCLDEGGDVKDTASLELSRLARSIANKNETIQRQGEQIAKTFAAHLQDQFITIRDGRFVVPVKARSKSAVSGIIHGQSASGETFFIEPMKMVKLNNELRELEMEREREVAKILAHLSEAPNEHCASILQNYEILIEMDFHHAISRFATANECSVPTLAENKIVLKNAKNPALMLQTEVVPFDLEMDDKRSVVVITGPNAGGKTVTLKAVGMLTWMANCGLPVPAKSAILPLVDSIFADIGDAQSIEQNLSTFSAHLENLKTILSRATKQSLVLMDELGTGTDPREGVALARAFLEEMANRRVLTIVTTHHGDIKSFAYEHEQIENGSMIFNPDSLRPTYQFRQGLPGSSYAFEISDNLGIPKKIIRRAREIFGDSSIKLESLILHLEKQMLDYEVKIQSLSADRDDLDKSMKKYEIINRQLMEKWDSIEQEGAEKAEEIVAEANRIVEKVVKEIRESKASSTVLKKSHQTIQKQKKEIKKRKRPKIVKYPRIKPEKLRDGLAVKVVPFQAVGTVCSGADKNGKVLVELDNMRSRVPLDWLMLIEKNAESKVSASYSVQSAPVRRADVRGLNVREALMEVDKMIDRILLTGLKEVEILHGTGEGVLMREIRNFLKSDSRILSFEKAPQEQGGNGVTLAELK